MNAGSLPQLALRITNRISPVGRLLATLCLATGYLLLTFALVTPDALRTALNTIPDGTVLPIAYLVTFAYPAAYAILSLVAAVAASTELSEKKVTSTATEFTCIWRSRSANGRFTTFSIFFSR